MTRADLKTTANRRIKASESADGPREVTRHISKSATAMLWGCAAGRCEFLGCNRPLWKSDVTQETVNVGQMAHIWSFSSGGPRGNAGVPDDDLNGIANLFLVCYACHRKIDQKRDGGRYPASLLREMKAEHERRIEFVTGISAERRSHVLLYGANIGEQSSPLNFNDASSAMFPDRFPADRALVLGLANSATSDRNAGYWESEERQLRTQFERQVRSRIDLGDIAHLSVFALAPQPLLVFLGTLLGDILPASVYQRHREPATWAWPKDAKELVWDVREPASTSGPPALVLAISATVMPDRITPVLGPDASIWTVSLDAPHNDALKSPQHLSGFRARLRPLLDRIKAIHGQSTPLHVFPASPVSAAVELGRIRMPKADMPWQLYDQNSALGGFVPALSILPKDR